MKDSPAAHAGDSVEADQLLKAIGALELETDALGKKLEPLDKPEAMLPHKSLSHLREGLKRIAARLGVCMALVDRIVEEPATISSRTIAVG